MKGIDIMKNQWLSNGSVARDINDFEQVMNEDDFNALIRMLKEKMNIDKLDEAYYMIEDIKEYIVNSKRINKVKIINMLDEILNKIDEY